ncbi:transposase family protein [Luteimicrobium subarcticum]|uniref:transposase family protein n=1 Tax=Luteimicrobium subarcticum TaxID=620910 RepID=UPI002481EA12|nr:transposase family protein [Luteimicrobium subarcticum]
MDRRLRTDHDKQWNRSVASLRAPVERVIGLIKCWKIVAKGWRGPLRELPRIIRLITLLERYRTGW